MIKTTKIKKDKIENYFLSFKPQAQRFYLEKKLKNSITKPIYDIFF